MNLRSVIVCFSLLMGIQSAQAQSDPKPGGFGLAVEVDVDGVFSPTLRSVTVKSVSAGRPAAMAGIAAGDQIVEIDGKAIAGSKAKEMEKSMKKNVGETMNVKIKKPDGQILAMTLVASAKPN